MNHWCADRADQMRERLERCGASASEIDQFIDQWVNDDEWTIDDKKRVWALGDPKLRNEIVETRAENFVPTPDEEERVERVRDMIADDAELAAEAAEIAVLTVAQVMEWVGIDDERAKASLAHELGCAEPRKTLIRKLRDRRAEIEHGEAKQA